LPQLFHRFPFVSVFLFPCKVFLCRELNPFEDFLAKHARGCPLSRILPQSPFSRTFDLTLVPLGYLFFLRRFAWPPSPFPEFPLSSVLPPKCAVGIKVFSEGPGGRVFLSFSPYFLPDPPLLSFCLVNCSSPSKIFYSSCS